MEAGIAEASGKRAAAAANQREVLSQIRDKEALRRAVRAHVPPLAATDAAAAAAAAPPQAAHAKMDEKATADTRRRVEEEMLRKQQAAIVEGMLKRGTSEEMVRDVAKLNVGKTSLH